MTLDENTFPIGYFYILSKMNGMALGVDPTKEVGEGTPIVTVLKTEEKPQRDTQLWMHQAGFLTNKAYGLVLDIGKSKKFSAIFTGEDNLYVDKMKSPEEAVDQRFGFSSENGYLYTLEHPTRVVDIRKKEDKEGAILMIYDRAESPEEALNQLWQLELADPPKVIDSSDEEEDDSKSARLSAWFGSWFGHGDKKREVLNEDALQTAHKQVYEKKKHHLAYEVIAGAVAVQAVKYYMKKKEEDGEDVRFKGAKEAIAGIAAAEMVKMFMERGTDDDDDDDDDEKKQQKQSMLQKMAVSAATNYYETKYS